MAKKSLLPTDALAKAALASLSDAVIVCNAEGQVALVNRAASHLLGTPAGQALAQPLTALLQAPPALLQAMERLCADPYTSREGERILLNVGNQTFNVRPFPVLSETGDFLGVAVMLREITQELEREESHNAALTSTVRQMRSALTTLEGYTDLLIHQAIDRLETSHRRFLRVIQSNIHRLHDLVSGLSALITAFEMRESMAESQPKVLVVEDDRAVSQLLSLPLREEGYEVITTEWGEEALWLARTQEVDLITLDIMLPDINGLEVLRRLRADPRTARIPVIVVSVMQPEDQEGLGDVVYVRKPFAVDELLEQVRQALGKPPRSG